MEREGGCLSRRDGGWENVGEDHSGRWARRVEGARGRPPASLPVRLRRPRIWRAPFQRSPSSLPSLSFLSHLTHYARNSDRYLVGTLPASSATRPALADIPVPHFQVRCPRARSSTIFPPWSRSNRRVHRLNRPRASSLFFFHRERSFASPSPGTSLSPTPLSARTSPTRTAGLSSSSPTRSFPTSASATPPPRRRRRTTRRRSRCARSSSPPSPLARFVRVGSRSTRAG